MPPAPFPISDHCNGHRFFNPRYHENRNWFQVLRWRLTSRPSRWPAWVDLPSQPFDPAPPSENAALTWINHASFLLRTPSLNLLIDPVFNTHLSPLPRTGPRRVHVPGVSYEQLPKIDVILLSHDHYDHLDLPTLRRLAAAGHDPLVIAPLGNAPLIRRSGLTRIVELDWWQTHAVGSTVITLTPARHWSNRISGARNARLWGGFHLALPGQPFRHLYFSGDTGYDTEMFTDIRRRLGPPDLALLPIGAYEPRWFMSAQHCNPAEAVQIHRDLGTHRSIGMHWGCWQLTDESREAPLHALASARAAAGLAPGAFGVLAPGETIFL